MQNCVDFFSYTVEFDVDAYIFPQVYDGELEKSEDFNDFNDFCETFELERGKDDDDEESNVMGEFKVSICTNIVL